MDAWAFVGSSGKSPLDYGQATHSQCQSSHQSWQSSAADIKPRTLANERILLAIAMIVLLQPRDNT
jgi:hypothetical protein